MHSPGSSIERRPGPAYNHGMAFIQLIEFTTKRIGDVEALMTEWEAKTEAGGRPRGAR